MSQSTLRRLAALTLAIPSLGCLHGRIPAQVADFRVRDHAVFVHTDGRAREVLAPAEAAARGTAVGRRLSHGDGARELSRLMAVIRESPHDTILIYVHGGRISYDRAFPRVATRGAAIDSAGYFPLFINWNGSVSSSLWWHLFRMRQGQDWGPVRGVLSSPFVATAALGRAVSRAPLTTMHQAADYCRTLGGLARGDVEGRVEQSRFCRVPGVDAARREQAAFERAQRMLAFAGTPVEPPTLNIGIGTHDVGYREGTMRVLAGAATIPSKLVLAPVADGFGAGAWGELRRRVNHLIHTRSELVPDGDVHSEYRPAEGYVHALMDSLQALMRAQAADTVPVERRRQRSVILAGHSMGTIVVDQILSHFPDLDVGRIIYLAPATTVAELEAGVVRFLERHPRTTYYHGMLHPYADAGEWQPGLLDLVPRGSLLEWVDDYLTTPDTPMDRVSGKWSNLVVATHIFTPAVRGRVVIKAFGVKDPADAWSPVLYEGISRHAGFSDPAFAFWDDRYWQLRPHRTRRGTIVAPTPPGLRNLGDVQFP